MGDYSHKVYVFDSSKAEQNTIYTIKPGHYESKNYNYNLIVDKTMFTMADVWSYSKTDSSILPSHFQLEWEYKNVEFEKSRLPYVNNNYYSWRVANIRSQKEGLDTAYIRINPRSKDAEKLILLGDPNLDYNSCETCTMIAVDTSASGYRVPFREEWNFLMRAGASTRYYWGDEGRVIAADYSIISQYEWINGLFDYELKPVAQLLPNAFGLYDMIGIAGEICDNSPEGFFICGAGYGTGGVLGKANYKSFRLIRKTPKLHKLEKF